jgi:hypothetical protein
MKAAIVVLFLAGCFLLYYGGTMLLLVPGAPGEAYLNWDRVRYGGIPFVIGLGALVIGGRVWGRARAGGWQRGFGAAGAVVLGAVVVVIGCGVLILLATRRQP